LLLDVYMTWFHELAGPSGASWWIIIVYGMSQNGWIFLND